MKRDIVALFDGTILEAHPSWDCAGRHCSIHNPSWHALMNAPLNWRSDRGLMERVCEHGIGHPDPDHLNFYAAAHTTSELWVQVVHGCDGCCQGNPC